MCFRPWPAAWSVTSATRPAGGASASTSVPQPVDSITVLIVIRRDEPLAPDSPDASALTVGEEQAEGDPRLREVGGPPQRVAPPAPGQGVAGFVEVGVGVFGGWLCRGDRAGHGGSFRVGGWRACANALRTCVRSGS